jgi:hypothetical protein
LSFIYLLRLIYYYYSLLNVRYRSLLGPRGLLLIYMWGENSNRENLVIHLPAFRTRLLSACLAPTGRLWYSIFLLFGHLGNHCCRNNLMDVLVSQTSLYHRRVIRGCLLLTPLPSSTISFATQNWFSIFWLISHLVTALRPFCVESSVL